MRGLGRTMPHTRLVFLIGSLALVGIPPFAGFFSKDSILAALLDRGAFGYVLFACGLAGAFLTGIYTFRLFFIVFGKERRRASLTCTARHEGPVLDGLDGDGARRAVGGRRLPPVRADLDAALDVARRRSRGRSRRRRAGRRGSRRPPRSAVGLAGIYVAYALYVAEDASASRAPGRCSSASSTGTSSTTSLFYSPPISLARGARAASSSSRVIAGSIDEVTRGFRLGAR